MDILGNKYTVVRTYIEQVFDKLKSWEQVEGFVGLSGDKLSLPILRAFLGYSEEDLNEEIWVALINYYKEKDKAIEITKLGNNIRNNASIPTDAYSSWQLYKQKLINQHWSVKSITNIEKSSINILSNLSQDTSETGPIKGLVVGNVQSGKTANMSGLMAMAADNGFNFFIVLSGVIENLRQQTSTRLYNDMNSTGNGHLHWKQVDKPSLKSKLPEHNISSFDLSENGKNRYFSVCLKNSTRLKALLDWLTSDEQKAKQLKILIIDDEADQASINTKKIEDEDPTKINGLIKKIVNSNKFKGINYIAYTATPYANILNEVGEESLYPKDFIFLLEPSEDYIGAKEIFGTEVPEVSPGIDIVRDIKDSDEEEITLLHEFPSYKIPKSLEKAVNWFILGVATLRAIDYRKPLSMLIHTSFKINDHISISKSIELYLKYFKNNYSLLSEELRNLYEDESQDFKKSHFLEAMKEYSSADNVPDYPKWEEVEKYLLRILRLEEDEYISHIPIGETGEPKFHKGFHLVIDNSRASADDQIVRLVYPSNKQLPNVAPAFIVVGGNTLSRGLTLEGLISTYFLRKTNQADTLMQMARWFGYRKGYEIFPRIWLTRDAYERYTFLSQMNEELRDEIKKYAINGMTPADYAPKVKNSANRQLIKITSNNKMQSAVATEFDFIGFNTQTIYFENDTTILEKNLKATSEFLNNLDVPIIKRHRMVWQNVDAKKVMSYLENYKVCEDDIKMSSLPALIKWIQENSETMANWNIIYSALGEIEESKGLDENWNIHGYSPKPVIRTKLKNRSSEKVANIGALRAPSDLLADITENLEPSEKSASKPVEIAAIRSKYGYEKTPQIIIYKVDKNQMTEDEFISQNTKPDGTQIKKKRAPLNFAQDVIGINVMIPGVSKGGNLAKYVSAKISVKNKVNDDFNEDGEDEENAN